MDLTNDALVYEGLQRYFRNAVVEHLRESLRNAYPGSWLAELKKPFKAEEWDRMKLSADEAAAIGVVGRTPVDDFDYLSVNHFYNLFDVHFGALVPTSELPSEDYVPKLRQQLLGWLREIKAIRDPVAHPPTEELSPLDALRALDSARRVLFLLHQKEAASQITEVYSTLIARYSSGLPPEILSPPQDTLPPRDTIVVDFVGRQIELSQLWRWLADPDSFRWLLAGDGGKGKSAIAYKFAVDVRASAPSSLCGVFWMSSKRRRFDEGDTVEISDPSFWDLESALDKILSDYGWTESLQHSIEAKRITVLGLLEELPALLVVDDLDSIQPDSEDVVEFLTLSVPTTKSKVLITSRRRFAGMGRTCTVVEGLPIEEALQFIDSRAQLMGLDAASLSGHHKKEIARLCEGSPLYMEDMLRLCKFLPVQRAIEAWLANAGDAVRRYALQREMEMLSLSAREVLEVCSIVGGPVSTVELQRITGRSEEDTIAAIDELQQMYLVPGPQLVEGVPRFQLNRNTAMLVRASLEGSPKVLTYQNAIRAVEGGGFGRAHSQEVADHSRQARVLVEAGRFDDAEATVKAGLARRLSNDPTLIGMLGWVYKSWRPRRLTDARAAFSRACDLGSPERAMYAHWSLMEGDEAEWQRAAEAAERGLERVGYRDADLLQLAGYARSRLGQVMLREFNETRAKDEFAAADRYLVEAIKRAQGGSRDFAILSRAHRALVLNSQARHDSAEELCRRLISWLEWNSHDPAARAEVDRQRERCPEAMDFLAER